MEMTDNVKAARYSMSWPWNNSDKVQCWERLFSLLEEIRDGIQTGNGKIDQLLKGQVKIMATVDDLMTAITNLTTAVAAETADIDAALAIIVTPGATPAQIQAATDAIAAATKNITDETAKIKAAVPGAP